MAFPFLTKAADALRKWLGLIPVTIPALPPAADDPKAALALADALLARVNALRADRGVPPLDKDVRLAFAAYGHATYMAENATLGHTEDAHLPEFTGRSLEDRVRAAGVAVFLAIGENVYQGGDDAYAVYAAWVNSPGHYRNMVHPAYARCGVARCWRGGHSYWCAVFAN